MPKNERYDQFKDHCDNCNKELFLLSTKCLKCIFKGAVQMIVRFINSLIS